MNTSDTFRLGLGVSPDHNPDAAAQARARIATLPDPHHNPPHTAPTIPLSRPISPAAQAVKQSRPATSPRVRGRLPSRLQPILTAVGVFLLILALFKAPVIITQLTFHPSPTAGADLNNLAALAGDTAPAEPTLSIPKINVNAPVVYLNTTDETQFENALQGGVVHYAGTALPGQAGNTVIFGHSSNDWWQPGNYKFVFVLLDKLAAGDRFSVNYNSHKYIYEVTAQKVVEPTDLSVLNPTPDPEMTLITCTPPGTSWKRLIVTAKQVFPDPGGAQVALGPKPDASTGAILPGNAPSFTQQIGQILGSIRDAFVNLLDPNHAKNQAPVGAPPASLPSAI